MVARDGVEPPTPAFSGLDTVIAKQLYLQKVADTIAQRIVQLIDTTKAPKPLN
jgi:hypothetical protein